MILNSSEMKIDKLNMSKNCLFFGLHGNSMGINWNAPFVANHPSNERPLSEMRSQQMSTARPVSDVNAGASRKQAMPLWLDVESCLRAGKSPFRYLHSLFMQRCGGNDLVFSQSS